MRSFDRSLFADFFQFYIQDEAVPDDLSEAWTEEATDRMLATAFGTIGIGTVRNMDVPVSLQILDRQPDDDSSQWDHVVEASLDVVSGRIVISGCTDYLPDAEGIDLPLGTYQVRVSYGGLDTLSANGLEGDDHYRVQLWPATSIEVRVVKQRST